jgi:hypothetical protein
MFAMVPLVDADEREPAGIRRQRRTADIAEGRLAAIDWEDAELMMRVGHADPTWRRRRPLRIDEVPAVCRRRARIQLVLARQERLRRRTPVDRL